MTLVLLVVTLPALAQMQMINPFAGRMGAMTPGSMAPYGSRAGAMPHMMQSTNGMMMRMRSSVSGMMDSLNTALGGQGEQSMMPPGMEGSQRHGMVPEEEGIEGEAPEMDAADEMFELIVGACAGGAFIGAFAAATAIPAAGPAAAAAAPAAVTALAAAIGIGCGLGIVTATISVGAVMGYREVAR